MASPIGGNADPYANPYLSGATSGQTGAPGAADVRRTAGAQGQGQTAGASEVDKMWALAGVDGARAGRGTAGSAEVQNLAAMGPPPGPQVRADAHTAGDFKSLATQVNQAMAAGAATDITKIHADLAHLKTTPAPGMQTQNMLAKNFDFKAKANQVGKGIDQVVAGLTSANGNALFAFMVLRLKNGQNNVEQVNKLSDMASNLQTSSANEQLARNKASADAAAKAHKKAAKMGIFNKLLTIVFAIITVVAVVCAPITAMMTLAILGAMTVAFTVAATVKGIKNGKGFDLMGGLEIASYVGDALLLAVGIGAVIAAVRAATSGAGKSAARVAAKSATESATKAATTAGKTSLASVAKSAGSESERLAAEGMRAAMARSQRKTLQQLIKTEMKTGKTLQEAIKAVGGEVAKGGTKMANGKVATTAVQKALMTDAVEVIGKEMVTASFTSEVKMMAKKAAGESSKELGKRIGIDQSTRLAYAGGQKAAQAAVKGLDEVAMKAVLKKGLFKSAVLDTFKEAFSATGKAGAGQVEKLGDSLLKSAAKAPAGSATSKAGQALGKSLQFSEKALSGVRMTGRSPILINAAMTVGTQALEFTKDAAIQYPTAQLQADADEASAEAKMWKGVYDNATGMYDNAQQTLQNLVKTHSSDVDTVGQLLTEQHRAAQQMLNHLLV